MKKAALAAGALLAALAPAAFSQSYPDYRDRDSREWRARDSRDYRDQRGDFARVIESRPIRESGDRHDECWNPRAGHFEEVRGENKTRIGKGAAIGAVAGGVIGHQTDSNIGTGVGAVLGGIIGHQIERHNNENDKQDDLDFSRCRTVGQGGDNLVGYDVRYEYRGREYAARMDHDPGRTLRIGRDVNQDGTPYNAYR